MGTLVEVFFIVCAVAEAAIAKSLTEEQFFHLAHEVVLPICLARQLIWQVRSPIL